MHEKTALSTLVQYQKRARRSFQQAQLVSATPFTRRAPLRALSYEVTIGVVVAWSSPSMLTTARAISRTTKVIPNKYSSENKERRCYNGRRRLRLTGSLFSHGLFFLAYCPTYRLLISVAAKQTESSPQVVTPSPSHNASAAPQEPAYRSYPIVYVY